MTDGYQGDKRRLAKGPVAGAGGNEIEVVQSDAAAQLNDGPMYFDCRWFQYPVVEVVGDVDVVGGVHRHAIGIFQVSERQLGLHRLRVRDCLRWRGGDE